MVGLCAGLHERVMYAVTRRPSGQPMHAPDADPRAHRSVVVRAGKGFRHVPIPYDLGERVARERWAIGPGIALGVMVAVGGPAGPVCRTLQPPVLMLLAGTTVRLAMPICVPVAIDGLERA